MPPRPSVLDYYRPAPLPVRAHVALRWRTCPFDEIAAHVPTKGRVLDLGCGHGLLAAHLALSSPRRDVVGVDLDDRKLLAACSVAERLRAAGASVSFEHVERGFVPDGPWDAIVIVDVLYLMASDEQRDVLSAAAARLRPGGYLIVKEMGNTPRWKARWNRVQEGISVRVLGITVTSAKSFCFTPPGDLRAMLSASDLEVSEEELDAGYLHPHFLMVGRATQTGSHDSQ